MKFSKASTLLVFVLRRVETGNFDLRIRFTSIEHDFKVKFRRRVIWSLIGFSVYNPREIFS